MSDHFCASQAKFVTQLQMTCTCNGCGKKVGTYYRLCSKLLSKVPKEVMAAVITRYRNSNIKLCIECLRKEFGCSLHPTTSNCLLVDRSGNKGMFRSDGKIKPHRYAGTKFACVPTESTEPILPATLDKKEKKKRLKIDIENFLKQKQKEYGLTMKEVRDVLNKDFNRLLDRERKRKERAQAQRKTLTTHEKNLIFQKNLKKFEAYQVLTKIMCAINHFSRTDYLSIKGFLTTYPIEPGMLSKNKFDNISSVIKTMIINQLYDGSVCRVPLELMKMFLLLKKLKQPR